MATTQEFLTAQEAAARLGVTDARIRQICAVYNDIGQKHGHAWILTSTDIERIRMLPEFRKKSVVSD